jgi:hypothetical protein
MWSINTCIVNYARMVIWLLYVLANGFNTPPQMIIRTQWCQVVKANFFSESQKICLYDRLGQCVCKHLGGWFVADENTIFLDVFSCEMKFDIYMFGSRIRTIVCCHGNTALIVLIHNCWKCLRMSEVVEELSEPYYLSDSIV